MLINTLNEGHSAQTSTNPPRSLRAVALELRGQYRDAIEQRKAARERWFWGQPLLPEHKMHESGTK